MNWKQNISFILFFSILFSVFAEPTIKIDSLKNQLKTAPQKERLLLLTNIANYYLNISPDSCFKYASNALLIAKKQANDTIIADMYTAMGVSTHYKGNDARAFEYFTYAIQKYKLIGNKEKLSSSYVNMGVIYYSNKDYQKAIKYYKLAIEPFKALEEKKYLTVLYDNIGLCYQNIDSVNSAIEYYEKSIEIKNKLDSTDIYNALSSISLVYRLKKEYKKALDNYQKILDYTISNQKDIKTAITYLDIASCYLEEDKYLDAEHNYNLGLNGSLSSNLNNLTQKFYLSLSNLYEKMGDDKKALEYYKFYASNRDSSLNDIIYKKLEDDIAKVKEEKIRFQKKLDKVKLQRQKNISLILIIAIVLGLIIIIVILFQVKIHRKKNRDLKALLNKISESERKLIEANNTKDKFFSIIAHDLKNPLSAFMSVADFLILKSDTISEKMHAELLHKIKKSADDLNILLENLLSWAKGQMNKIEYYPELFDINNIIEEVISLNRNFSEKKSIKIENRILNELDVFADINLVKTIIRNLISNAIKFTNNGGKIIIYTDEIKDNINIYIADNGIGISKEKQAQLFQVKYLTKESELVNQGGTGLGLVICKEFIAINKGKIFVDSQENRGSTFIISLPKSRKDED